MCGQLSIGSLELGHVVGHGVVLPKFLGEFKFLEEFRLTDVNWMGINLVIIIRVFPDCTNGGAETKMINPLAKSG